MSLLRRGDIVALPQPRAPRGREQSGRRYGIVLQSDRTMWLSTVLVAPTSTGAQPAPFRPEVKIRGRHTRALVDQLTAADPLRLGTVVGRLDAVELREVDEALKDVLGLF